MDRLKTENGVYSFGGNRFCRKCRLKVEDQKKEDEKTEEMIERND